MSIATAPHPTRRRSLRAALTAMVVLSGTLTIVGLALPASPAAAAPITVNQCNGIAATADGATTRITCTVSVVNTIDNGVTSSVTTVTRQCDLGPCPEGDGTFTTQSTDLVTRVEQCNNSGNDAANPMVCNVDIVNVISGNTPRALPLGGATVNQCVGSAGGGGGSLVCSPNPSSTTSATITQCNGSGNGAGAVVTCTVGSGSTSRAIPVSVNQCNDSENSGGSTVTCRTNITTRVLAVAAPSPTPTATTTPQVGTVPTGGVATGGGSTSGSPQAGLVTAGSLLLLAAGMGILLRRRFAAGR